MLFKAVPGWCEVSGKHRILSCYATRPAECSWGAVIGSAQALFPWSLMPRAYIQQGTPRIYVDEPPLNQDLGDWQPVRKTGIHGKIFHGITYRYGMRVTDISHTSYRYE